MTTDKKHALILIGIGLFGALLLFNVVIQCDVSLRETIDILSAQLTKEQPT